MSLETAESLLAALRTSGLLAPEQLRVLTAEVRPFRKDFPAVVKHLLKTEWMTVYQIRKVLHGKAAELFIGQYLILDRLGEGGMGRVYRARQTRIGRLVALKVIRPSLLASPLVRARYQREVEAAGALRHPNIVAVEDAGEADGKSYLAMEFVDGIDLSLLMRDYRTLEVVEACEYARQTALGLQHAHEAGFVHRDIKPSNILVSVKGTNSSKRSSTQLKRPVLVTVRDRQLALDPSASGRGESAWGKSRFSTWASRVCRNHSKKNPTRARR
jgi:serine/threonine-protein kinase